MNYVAFLRGINVGGNRMISMDELRTAFASMGCTDVKTLLNSGNVLFSSGITNQDRLTQDIEEMLRKTFGINISVILRTIREVQTLVEVKPFNNIPATKDTRLYVTFLREKSKIEIRIPCQSPEKDFTILCATDREVCSVLTLSPKRGTTDAMNILEKTFGKAITTRNWNTIIRILKYKK